METLVLVTGEAGTWEQFSISKFFPTDQINPSPPNAHVGQVRVQCRGKELD